MAHRRHFQNRECGAGGSEMPQDSASCSSRDANRVASRRYRPAAKTRPRVAANQTVPAFVDSDFGTTERAIREERVPVLRRCRTHAGRSHAYTSPRHWTQQLGWRFVVDRLQDRLWEVKSLKRRRQHGRVPLRIDQMKVRIGDRRRTSIPRFEHRSQCPIARGVQVVGL